MTDQVFCCPVCEHSIDSINDAHTCRLGCVHCPNCFAELDKNNMPSEWFEP